MRFIPVFLAVITAACGSGTVDGYADHDSGIAAAAGISSASATDHTALHSWGDKCLDVNSNNASNGTKIQMWSCNGGEAQAWSFDGTTMRSGNGKCLDIPGNWQVDGAALELYDCNGTDAQKWTQDGDRLRSTAGFCMDVRDWDTADGAVVELWSCTGNDNQSWSWASGGSGGGGGGGATNTSGTIHGVYCGNDPNDVLQYEGWLGAKADAILGYTGNANWADYDGSVGWATGVWQSIDRRVLWSIPLIPWGANLEAAARGDYNDHYRRAAETLAQFRPGEGKLYIRTAWEFNGSWFPWTGNGQPENFRNAFRQFVQTFRSVSDRFVFEWNVNIGSQSQGRLEDAYPGDDVVDLIGMDVYWNLQWSPSDPTQAFAAMRDQDYGLSWHQQFAAAHGKRTTYSEWGIQSDSAGDYIRLMNQWFDDHDVVYATYWNSNADFAGELSRGQYPNAGNTYRSLFGQ